MQPDYTNLIKNSLPKKTEKPTSSAVPTVSANSKNINTSNDKNLKKTFIIKRKKDDKINKKTFQTVMEADLLKTLDALAKKSGYSRNEMVNMMIEHCVKNFEMED